MAGGTICLNAVGRVQTKKRRAEIPVCNILAEVLRAWGEEDGWEGPLVRFRGQQIASIKTCWRNTRARAGVECSPYSLRHTVGNGYVHRVFRPGKSRRCSAIRCPVTASPKCTREPIRAICGHEGCPRQAFACRLRAASTQLNWSGRRDLNPRPSRWQRVRNHLAPPCPTLVEPIKM